MELLSNQYPAPQLVSQILSQPMKRLLFAIANNIFLEKRSGIVIRTM